MGIDLLDIRFWIKREFGVDLPEAELIRIALQRHPPDTTAGELHDLVCERCRAAGIPVTDDFWLRFKIILVNSLGVKPNDVRPESWLERDLRMD